MQAFSTLNAVALPITRPNLDTDQIVPARYLQKPRTAGFGDFLFHDVRRLADGTDDPAFLFNLPPYRDAKIAVGGANFACGSSREQAVWALYDHGYRVVIAPSFGDIFQANALKNGLLPIVLPDAQVNQLQQLLLATPGAMLGIDLPSNQVQTPEGVRYGFTIDAFARHCLLEGLDEIDYTLTQANRIAEYEQRTFGPAA